MRIFVTGAPGFIGSALVPELIQAGHHVLGLTRSEAGADALRKSGAEVLRGNLEDLDSLREGAAKTDGVRGPDAIYPVFLLNSPEAIHV